MSFVVSIPPSRCDLRSKESVQWLNRTRSKAISSRTTISGSKPVRKRISRSRTPSERPRRRRGGMSPKGAPLQSVPWELRNRPSSIDVPLGAGNGACLRRDRIPLRAMGSWADIGCLGADARRLPKGDLVRRCKKPRSTMPARPMSHSPPQRHKPRRFPNGRRLTPSCYFLSLMAFHVLCRITRHRAQ